MLIYGGWREQTWSQRNETDEAGLSWSRTRRQTHSQPDVCELKTAPETTGAWLRWVTSEKTIQLLPGEDIWRKHLQCDYYLQSSDMRQLLLVLNVHISLWSISNEAPVNFVELNEDGSPKTDVKASTDSVSEISLRILKNIVILIFIFPWNEHKFKECDSIFKQTM